MKIERIKLIEIIAYISSVLPSTLFIIWMSLSTTLDIGKKFLEQNKFIDNILEKIDREEGKSGQNYIVSVRSYLDRVIGESLNQALYDLEVQRERSPDKKELFTAIGSIKFISQYLLDHKQ